MKRTAFGLAFALASWFSVDSALATTQQDVGGPQGEFERSVTAVVRNKKYYKSGNLEVGAVLGTMPYDSVVSHYSIGGRLAWHLSDHYSWEILDAQLMLPSVTSFTTDLVASKNIADLQTVKLKQLVGTSFLFSPIYGKIRFFGAQVLYFDMYTVLGGGFANTETLKFNVATSGGTSTAQETSLGTAWDPMFYAGLGFKIFLGKQMGIVIDLRDYVVSSNVYGRRSLKSNFAVTGGLVFFLPGFG